MMDKDPIFSFLEMLGTVVDCLGEDRYRDLSPTKTTSRSRPP